MGRPQQGETGQGMQAKREKSCPRFLNLRNWEISCETERWAGRHKVKSYLQSSCFSTITNPPILAQRGSVRGIDYLNPQ